MKWRLIMWPWWLQWNPGVSMAINSRSGGTTGSSWPENSSLLAAEGCSSSIEGAKVFAIQIHGLGERSFLIGRQGVCLKPIRCTCGFCSSLNTVNGSATQPVSQGVITLRDNSDLKSSFMLLWKELRQWSPNHCFSQPVSTIYRN